ncbi:E3 ubiquitin-protein ligase TTC3 isoform X2 [Engraulis encrasicolus]|uniref:E3 ubiquitin-protein ligase TTC3 isoform X2 n=1 Tax=Engraulis encrasicolus TaxID=184585 RepID=UPI002FD1DF41
MDSSVEMAERVPELYKTPPSSEEEEDPDPAAGLFSYGEDVQTWAHRCVMKCKETLDDLESVLAAWYQLPPNVKLRVSHSLKVATFWWHILLRPDETHATTIWAIVTGFLDSNPGGDLSLAALERIEILECLLNAMQKGWLNDKLTKQLIPMSACFQLSDGDLTDEALAWLLNTGEPSILLKLQMLGPRYVYSEVIRFVFGKFSPLSTEAVAGQSILLKLKEEYSLEPDPWSKEKSEDMKNKGNEQFRKNKFQVALKWYTKAIKYHPTNHVLYGNRALSLIRIGKYLKAVGDGKRAIVLKPDWAKGHYRFCEALFLMEQRKKAVKSNERAHTLCKADSEGLKELERQRVKFLEEIEEAQQKADRSKKLTNLKSPNKRPHGTMAKGAEPQCDLHQRSASPKTKSDISPKKEEPKPLSGYPLFRIVAEYGMDGSDEEEVKPTKPANKRETKPKREEKKSHGAEATPQSQEKAKPEAKPKSKSSQAKKAQLPKGENDVKTQLSSTISDAHVALNDHHWVNAKQAFLQALDMLDSSPPQKLSVSSGDKLLLMYGYALALIEIGQPQELAEASKQFGQIQLSCDEKFESLVYFGVGRVLLKENRFPEALQQFSEALQAVEKTITSEELIWPTTKVPVKEAQKKYLTDFLETSMEICRFPPPPDAVCRHKIFQDHVKKEIYFTDPGFKGFHRLVCDQRCAVEFHTSCWKKFKTVTFPDKTDKDFIQNSCFTPDCTGKICHVVIVGANGRMKCEFETTTPLKQTSEKPKIKQQPPTPSKSMKIKEERKFKPTRLLQDSESVRNQLSPKQSINILAGGDKVQAWVDEDFVLRQLGEMRNCFADQPRGVSTAMTALKPWMESDSAKGLERPALLTGSGEEPADLSGVVDIVLQRKSRVWARIFVHELSDFSYITPKLLEWAQHLNAQGLKVAQAFIERYAEPLEELDLNPLLAFPPVQDALVQRFGTMPDSFFSGNGLTVTEYLRQASPHDMRLFIWTLEENRELYPSCHMVLDDYFATDCSYLVIKKTENENSANQHLKKSKNKRKKGKESKTEFFLSGMGTGAVREEREDEFLYDEDSFMLLDSLDPFCIPEHLRDQVAEFEEEVGAGDGYYVTPDPARQILYDYFVQVLDEHGPLKIDDPLLVGELENFPEDPRRTIKESGGLKPFLLQSLRFVMKDDVVGLMKHVGILSNVAAKYSDSPSYCPFEDVDEDDGTCLNPCADEFYPNGGEEAFMNAKAISRIHNMAGIEDWSDCYLKHDPDLGSVPFARPIHTCLASIRSQDSCSKAQNKAGIEDWSDCFLKHNQDSGSILFARPMHACMGATNNQSSSSQMPKISHPPGCSSENVLSGKRLEMFGTKVASPSKKQKDTGSPSKSAHHVKSGGAFPGGNDGGNTSSPPHEVMDICEQQGVAKKSFSVAVNTEACEIIENMKGDMMKKEKTNLEFKNKIPQLRKALDDANKKREEESAQHEETHQEICQKLEVINKDLSAFQQKVDEEMKMYQPEKKENQETLKALKEQISTATAANDSVANDIIEQSEKYDTRHTHLSTARNQLVAEKSSLKGEVDRYRPFAARSSQRCQQAWVLMLESQQTQGLRGLKRCVYRGKSILRRISELTSRYPASGLERLIDSWKTYTHDAEQKIAQTQTQFRELIEMVKNGSSLSSLPQLPVPTCPPTPPEPILDPQIPAQRFGPRPGISQPLNPQMPFPFPIHNSLQLLDTLDFSEDQRSTGPSESSRHQASSHQAPGSPIRPIARPTPSHSHTLTNTPAAAVSRPTNSSAEDLHPAVGQSGVFGAQSAVGQRAPGPHPSARQPGGAQAQAQAQAQAPVWQCEAAQRQAIRMPRALNVEDPCIICHEEVKPETMCVLECRHAFHNECIRSWLNTQSTCPTCRKHVLQVDEFPGLPVRPDRPNE